MRALIDGDVITYQAGFASDQRIYHVGTAQFSYKKDAVEYCKRVGSDLKNITKTIEPEPVAHCLHSVKKMLESIKDAVDADTMDVILSGSTNFREDLVHDYKANRDPTAKPIWYEEIKAYLRDVHGAKTTDGVEADDVLGYEQWNDLAADSYEEVKDELSAETVICTVDKDLNMIEGWHYNWRQDQMYWVDQENADRFFFQQWLTGDAADNIHGLKGVGEKTAQKILADLSNPKDMYEEVMKEYLARTSLSFHDIHIIGDLLWIQRREGERWDEWFGLVTDRKALEDDDAAKA